MEAALEAAEARLRSILETVPDAMIIIDERGVIESLSATAERLFGYGADEVAGRNISHADADAVSRAARRLSRSATSRPASGGSSASAASWSASARTARPFRCISRWASCGPAERHYFTGFIRDLTDQQLDRDAGSRSCSRK